MSPQKKRKTVVKSKAKAVAKNVNKININIGKTSQKKSAPKKATIVQNMPVQTSPTIYNPAPTPFYVSQPQPKPYSTFQETISQAKREDKEIIANAVQERVIPIPTMSVPSGSVIDTPASRQFTNTDTESSFTRLSYSPAEPITIVGEPQAVISGGRGRPKGEDVKIQTAKEEARAALTSMGVSYGKNDSLGTLQNRLREEIVRRQPLKKDPFP
jgi:hypothetical protein